MIRFLAASAVLGLCAPVAASAQATGRAAHLRELVFQIVYSAHSLHSKRTSGFSGTVSGAAGVTAGNGTASVGLDGDDSGRLVVDVIAATADGGLVVDVTYDGRSASQPTTRVAILPDGRLSADPQKPLGTQAVHVLPLLSRGFVANRVVDTGSTWEVPQAPPARGKTVYTVSALDGDLATLAIDGSMTFPGVSGFEETDKGTATYATDRLNPITYDVNLRIERRNGIDETIVTTARLTATLLHDSFAK